MFDSENSYFWPGLSTEVNFNLSPTENPFPIIERSVFKATDIVPGMDTPVSLNVSSGAGVSFFEQEATNKIFIRATNSKERYLVYCFIKKKIKFYLVKKF